MSENIFGISHNHGREMYIIGLELSVGLIEIMGDGALEYLKEKVAEERKELEDERAQQIQRRALSEL